MDDTREGAPDAQQRIRLKIQDRYHQVYATVEPARADDNPFATGALATIQLRIVNRRCTVGFYGKLPSHGDFLRRRVSDAFVDAWDAWLRECLAASRDALGPRWLDIYLTSPLMAFRVCGRRLRAGAGDRAGGAQRRPGGSIFPGDARLRAARARQPRHGRARRRGSSTAAERLVIETLASERVDFDRFDRGVVALEQELAATISAAGLVLDPAASAVVTDSAAGVAAAACRLVGGRALRSSSCCPCTSKRSTGHWSCGGPMGPAVVEPSCLVLKGLPGPELYPALLEGSWSAHRWRSVPARVSDDATVPPTGTSPAETLLLPVGCCDGRGSGAAQQRRWVRRASGGRDLGGRRRHGRP